MRFSFYDLKKWGAAVNWFLWHKHCLHQIKELKTYNFCALKCVIYFWERLMHFHFSSWKFCISNPSKDVVSKSLSRPSTLQVSFIKSIQYKVQETLANSKAPRGDNLFELQRDSKYRKSSLEIQISERICRKAEKGQLCSNYRKIRITEVQISESLLWVENGKNQELIIQACIRW